MSPRDRDDHRATLVGVDGHETDPPPDGQPTALRPRRLSLQESADLALEKLEGIEAEARGARIWRGRVDLWRKDTSNTLERIELAVLTLTALQTDDRERIKRAERVARAAMDRPERASRAEAELVEYGLDRLRKPTLVQKLGDLFVKHSGPALKQLLPGLVALILLYLAIKLGVRP